MENKLDSLFSTRLFVSVRKQIAVIRHEKLFEISRAVLRDKSLRKDDLYDIICFDTIIKCYHFLRDKCN